MFNFQIDKIEDATKREKVKQIVTEKFRKFLQPGGKGIQMFT